MYQGEYRLVGGELSFFTRKLEAQLRFQRVPWSWHLKTAERAAEIESRVATHFIPVLETPDGWMIHDTISIGPMLSDRFSDFSVIPDRPLQRATTFILEDFFNHWLGRFCVHTRWCYPDNVDWVGLRLASNIILGRSMDKPLNEKETSKFSDFGQTMYQQFGKQVCEYNGVQADSADAVKAEFGDLLDAICQHLSQHEYLLGARPCLADFALAGACKAHFITDPEPLAWLGTHKSLLVAYTNKFFEPPTSLPGPWEPGDKVPESLAPVLDYMRSTYIASARANIEAGVRGEKYYECDFGYGPSKARTQRRLNKARLHVRDELSRIGADSHEEIDRVFGTRGILDHYMKD